MLKIVSIPNPVLTNGTEKIDQFDSKLIKLVKDMDQTLQAQVDPQGVGLAAPQVGINKALFIIKPSPDTQTEAFVNPQIVETVTVNNNEIKNEEKNTAKKKKKNKLEGCLSIPKIWGPVDRAKKVYLEYQDLTGNKIKKWFSGFTAVIIQHEMDHLNGILFTQRALEQNQQLYEEKDGELKKLNANL